MMESSPITRSSTKSEEFLPLNEVADLGRFLRVHRKARKLSIHDAAALAGCSVQFLHDLESGKPTIRMGNALGYARKLGLELHMSGPKLDQAG